MLPSLSGQFHFFICNGCEVLLDGEYVAEPAASLGESASCRGELVGWMGEPAAWMGECFRQN